MDMGEFIKTNSIAFESLRINFFLSHGEAPSEIMINVPKIDISGVIGAKFCDIPISVGYYLYLNENTLYGKQDNGVIDGHIFYDLGEISDGCRHEWKKYVGFTEIYDFCCKCNEKSIK